MKVAVSFIKSKYNEKDTIKLLDKTSADFIHVDIMDGKFVKHKNYSPENIKEFTKNINKLLDVHLMVEQPENYVEKFALLNTICITFHLEAVKEPKKIIDLIHSYGIRCGISIKPKTNIKKLLPYINDIEQVLIMSVEPGEGGQKFMPEMVKKITAINKMSTDVIIAVDGGINEDTIKLVKEADLVISGSYVCESSNYEKNIVKLKEANK